jgi:UPF0716 family protein affecting phage T7 exclusion
LLDHERSYHGFLIGARWTAVMTAVALTFLILAFATSAGFWGAAFVALVTLAVGVWLVRDRGKANWVSNAATLFMTTSVESGDHHPAALAEEAARERGRATQAR